VSPLPIVTIATSGVASAATTAVPAGYLQQQVAWGDCAWWNPILEQYGYKHPQCASVTVPRDWANPGTGQDLTIAISRVRAADPAHRQGILFTNPGGPGGNGVTVPLLLTSVQAGQRVAASYDVIGMDPRGVHGFGTTPLNCDIPLDQLAGLAVPDRRDLSPAAIAVWQKLSKVIADACAANPLTPYINTWQTTHDMDLIRILLGEQKLNYLGYSYGTWLGAKYAALFPQSTGRMVLDSNTGWMDPLADTFLLQPLGFDRRFRQQWAPWAARQVCQLCPPGVDFSLGHTADQVLATYEQVRAAAKAKYGPALANVIDTIIAQELYSEERNFGFIINWVILFVLRAILVDQPQTAAVPVTETPVQPLLDQVLTALPDQTQPLVRQALTSAFGVDLAGATLGNLLQRPTGRITGGLDSLLATVRSGTNATGATFPYNDVFDAVRCGDAQQQHNPNWFVNYSRQTDPAYPLVGGQYISDPCAYWSLPTTPPPNPDPGKVTIVTVQSELDPPTPYENTNRNLAQFRGARLVSINDGGDHGESLIAGNGCVDDAVNAYLVDGVDLPAQTACTGPRLWKLFLDNTGDPRESQVYPVIGPLDGRDSPKSYTAALRADEHERQLHLQQTIGNTEGGQPLNLTSP